jgi:hypothetical protein
MKIKTDDEYSLFSVIAYRLSFNIPLTPEQTQTLINAVADAIDVYDVEHGYTMDTPTQEAREEHERDRLSEKNNNL